MPSKATVFIHYGQYKAVGVVEHRTSRLEGLQAVLEKEGHSVTLVKMDDWNSVELIVNKESVFTCDITDLDYGSDGGLDPLCQQAKEAVRKAY